MSSIGILQPVYLPWAGYFEQILLTDTFVFLDDVQYTKQDWRNRNQIKTPNGPIWLTIPVKKMPLNTPINQILINYEKDWIKKHLRSVQMNYRKAPYFHQVFPIYESVLLQRFEFLSDCTIELVIQICKYLNIKTRFVRASSIPKSNPIGRNQRLIEITKAQSANILYLGKSSANYASEDIYKKEGIKVMFQDYQYNTYPQLYGDFRSNMSIIDLLMNTGSNSKEYIAPSIMRVNFGK